jgi:hypothetical protein
MKGHIFSEVFRMKRFLLSLALIAAVVLVPVVAQESAPTAQFLSFDLGVSIGPDLDAASDIVAGSNFGINFVVIDKLLVGFNSITYSATGTYNGLRLGYSIIPQLGAAIGFGAIGSDPAISLGVFSTLFEQKASSGFVYGLGIKVDYLTKTTDFAKGKLLFGLGVNFGI